MVYLHVMSLHFTYFTFAKVSIIAHISQYCQYVKFYSSCTLGQHQFQVQCRCTSALQCDGSIQPRVKIKDLVTGDNGGMELVLGMGCFDGPAPGRLGLPGPARARRSPGSRSQTHIMANFVVRRIVFLLLVNICDAFQFSALIKSERNLLDVNVNTVFKTSILSNTFEAARNGNTISSIKMQMLPRRSILLAGAGISSQKILSAADASESYNLQGKIAV